MNSKKILFIVQFYPERAPSQRFRFEQYLDYFKKKGFECTHSYLITPENDRLFYSKGNNFKKLMLLIKFFRKRLKDLRKAKNYDFIFIQREAYYLGTAYFEKRLAKKNTVVFDFDDSIWLSHVSDANKKFNWLKKPGKTNKILEKSHYVIAGNHYLADYARQFNKNVFTIPTTIDTDYHHPEKIRFNDKICIGWTGSMTTIRHFDTAVPFLKKIKEKYGDKVCFKVIGEANYVNPELDIQGIKWQLGTEIEDLAEIDIGIMPLPDTEWAKGKCGLKGLQYMALKIPTIMTPVGVNTEIIKDGENGFLAKSNDEWLDKLSLVIENSDLRKQLGEAGRETVVEKYSVNSQKDKYIEVFELASKASF